MVLGARQMIIVKAATQTLDSLGNKIAIAAVSLQLLALLFEPTVAWGDRNGRMRVELSVVLLLWRRYSDKRKQKSDMNRGFSTNLEDTATPGYFTYTLHRFSTKKIFIY